MEKMTFTNRDRFKKTLRFERVDRLPMIEWAAWWDLTLDRWHSEGLPEELQHDIETFKHFGLDPHRQLWVGARASTCPSPPGHGMPIVKDRRDYIELKKHLYPKMPFDPETLGLWADGQNKGELIVWITLEGFFWFPRTMFGIEPHMYAFYDQPDLMKEMNEDLLEFNLRMMEEICRICVPDFMTFAEDMSYNHGPLLSKSQFDEFLAPYYSRIVPALKERGVVVFVDTDGDVTDPVKWYTEVGVEGFLPLERMAGVDVAQLRRDHPDLLMIGGFDKTVMRHGEERMRQEFERLLPVMRTGGFIVSVDHQTPPDVSYDQYMIYVRLLKEYCEKACL